MLKPSFSLLMLAIFLSLSYLEFLFTNLQQLLGLGVPVFLQILGLFKKKKKKFKFGIFEGVVACVNIYWSKFFFKLIWKESLQTLLIFFFYYIWILTNSLLDYFFLLYPSCLQNLSRTKIKTYVINQRFKFQVFVILNYAWKISLCIEW